MELLVNILGACPSSTPQLVFGRLLDWIVLIQWTVSVWKYFIGFIISVPLQTYGPVGWCCWLVWVYWSILVSLILEMFGVLHGLWLCKQDKSQFYLVEKEKKNAAAGQGQLD